MLKDFCKQIGDISSDFKHEIKQWSLLSVFALAVSGLLALILAGSRVPGAESILPWPLEDVFYHSLTTHVIFAVVIWFLMSFVSLIIFHYHQIYKTVKYLFFLRILIIISYVLIISSYFSMNGDPFLNNYVPIIDSAIFKIGVFIFFFAVLVFCLYFLYNLIFSKTLLDINKSSYLISLEVAAVVYIMSIICFVIAYIKIPKSLSSSEYFESLFWGGGHLLQIVNLNIFLSIAIFLFCSIDNKVLKYNFLSFIPVALLGVLIYFFTNIRASEHYEYFTLIYWFGLVVQPCIVLYYILRSIFSSTLRKIQRDKPVKIAFYFSVFLFLLGGISGYGVGEGNTKTTSHYHAVIGGINMLLMVFFARFLPSKINKKTPSQMLLSITFCSYGAGQFIQCLGLFVAGMFGIARKTAGESQGLDDLIKIISMGSAGIGALLAVLGGAFFVFIVGRMLLGPSQVKDIYSKAG